MIHQTVDKKCWRDLDNVEVNKTEVSETGLKWLGHNMEQKRYQTTTRQNKSCAKTDRINRKKRFRKNSVLNKVQMYMGHLSAQT